MTDSEIVDAFLRDTMKTDKRNLQSELADAMEGYQPDATTQAISFAMFASAASVISDAFAKSENPIKILQPESGERVEVDKLPTDMLEAMAQASMVLALARDEEKHSPLYYVHELVGLVCADEDTSAEQMRADFDERFNRHMLNALDNVRKHKHITAI